MQVNGWLTNIKSSSRSILLSSPKLYPSVAFLGVALRRRGSRTSRAAMFLVQGNKMLSMSAMGSMLERHGCSFTNATLVSIIRSVRPSFPLLRRAFAANFCGKNPLNRSPSSGRDTVLNLRLL